jgi:hypothetical protein
MSTKDVTSKLKLNSVIPTLNYVHVIMDIMTMEFKFVKNVLQNANLVIDMVVIFVLKVESTHLLVIVHLVNSLMPTTSVNHVPINVTTVSLMPTTV